MTTSCQNDELLDEHGRQVNDIKDLVEILFLGEVALMFTGLFLVMNALWFSVLFHAIAILFAIFVLRTAYRAAKVIPPSIPLQRPLGVVLYLSGHLMQFCFPGQLAIGLAVACPLAIMFLFEP